MSFTMCIFDTGRPSNLEIYFLPLFSAFPTDISSNECSSVKHFAILFTSALLLLGLVEPFRLLIIFRAKTKLERLDATQIEN